MIRYAIILCIALFTCFTTPARAEAPKEWEFSTPGGNLIGINDIFENQGVVLYDDAYHPFIAFISTMRFYEGFVAGEAAEGFFLFDEKTHTLEHFKTIAELQRAIKAKNLRPLSKDELDEYFNFSSSFSSLVMLFYMPCIFLIMMLVMREYPLVPRAKIAGFMVIEGAVVSAAALWLVLGLGGLFITFRFGGISFHLNTVVNLALMVFSLASIWFMLYLNEEVTQHKHPILVNFARFVSFICFTTFIYWSASALLEPSLPPEFWQGQF